ncbi:MAG: HAMP domain-containing protein [Actinobacteria bacterium]|nr:HAMP domain-containing protein [Actinomycetota bacterium]
MHVAGWILRPFRPRGTVRLRMTVLYGGLFLLSGAALLAIASGLVVGSSSTAEVGPANKAPVFAGSGEETQVALDKARQEIQSLQAALADQSAARAGISHKLLMASLIALGIMVALSVLLGWIFAGRSLRPLRLITATARRISEDNLDQRLAFSGPSDELKDLADTFDGLLERLESAFAAQRRFVANASHELRTPLATMRASVDVAMAKPGPVPEQSIALANRLRAELDRTDELLEGLLVLARAQHGALPGSGTIALDAIVAEALGARSAEIDTAGLAVRLAGDSPLLVSGSDVMLRRMVDNVIDNAIVHNEASGWIAVSTWTGPGTGRIVLENGGPVLDQDQVSQLGQPFRRLSADRVGSDRGSGLGLSIVAAIATAHGGSLDLRARPEGGLRVTITLPLAASPALAGASP